MLVLRFSPQLPAAETDDLLREILAAVRGIDEPAALAISLAVVTSYLPTPLLLDYLAELLEAGAHAARPSFLIGLAVIQGLVGELYRGNSTVAGNRIPGSPLARLGGSIAVRETEDAIRDVRRWWP